MLKTVDEAPEELQVEIQEFFPVEEWDNAASISFLESKWNAFAERDTTQGGAIPCGTVLEVRDGVEITAEHSISWFQINACNYPDWEWARLFNTRHNVGTAHDLWSRRGWSPWYFSAKQLGLL